MPFLSISFLSKEILEVILYIQDTFYLYIEVNLLFSLF